MPDMSVSLEDKYTVENGPVYMNGTQALVRLLMLQKDADLRAGLNTAGHISGYRGSPLAGLDRELWHARSYLDQKDIVFQPGLNEDLAATQVWGSQMTDLFPGAKYDGVFSAWYGKAPGVDRCGDVFKHGNHAGTGKQGGVLLLAGDDHAAKSTSTVLQSEYSFLDAMIPVLAPADPQDFLDFGLFGWALSRYSGLWVGFKMTAANIDTSGTVMIESGRDPFKTPNIEMPPGGLNIRLPDDRIPQESRLHHFKIPAALAFARANPIDRILLDSNRPRLGILTAGKASLDVAQALNELGIDEDAAEALGLRVYKMGMTWPIEEAGLLRFADGLEEILVVEEKRGFIEDQITSIFYNRLSGNGPRVVGKADETGAPLLPVTMDFNPNLVAQVIGKRLQRYSDNDNLSAAITALETRRAKDLPPPSLARIPFFCSGCPHNTSTQVPEGSHAFAGIGCHSLALYQGRADTFTHMGGEGASWIGLSPFTEMDHAFQNIGDGTYYHSGILGIRAAVAAGTNITFKLLYNDAVAMTGGQPVEGQPTVPQITLQLASEGVRQIIVVSDEPTKYHWREHFADGVTFRHRDELDAVQRELQAVSGVTALVYDQTCATEKRRRRKRGTYSDPAKRVFINELVCEGCGDCGSVSNCVSVTPVETEFGRKRQIDQSSCNKDFSCVKGFCPSFITIEGGTLRKQTGSVGDFDHMALPAPNFPNLDTPWPILITGIGGTGVVTIGQILGMAAHLEGKACGVADITGLSQKGGSVLSQITLAKTPEQIATTQIGPGETRALIACDIVTASMPDAMARLAPGKTHAVVNLQEVQTGAFTQNPDQLFPVEEMQGKIETRIDPDNADWFQASQIALSLVGDTIGTNMFMAGFAWQRGLIPLTESSIEEAVKLNGTAVDANLKAFRWGRGAAHDPAVLQKLLATSGAMTDTGTETIEDLIEHRAAFLTDYQNAAYADRYRTLVNSVKAVETRVTDKQELTRSVARYFFKLMAYKDEYEVARLWTDARVHRQIRDRFDGKFKIKFHLAPPMTASRDPVSGRMLKREYGPVMFWGFKALKRLKFLRGTAFDPFGKTAERRMERQLIADYKTLMAEICSGLSEQNHDIAVALASVPEQIRGYGHIKEEHVDRAKSQEAELLRAFRQPPITQVAAE